MGRKHTVYTLETLMQRAQAEGDCMLWTGYHANGQVPTVMHDGKLWPARKLVAHLGGDPVPKGGYWGTRCDHPSCIAAEHVLWRPKQAHLKRMVKKMFSTPTKVALRNAKMANARRRLSSEQAMEILRSNESHVEAAQRFGVSVTTVKKYRAGRAGVTLGANTWFSMLTMGSKT